jgi:glycosyltransferase involved in cell wall biosynthesis
MPKNAFGLRPAIIRFQDPSQWVSCQSITTNLSSAYEQLFDGCETVFFLGRNLDPGEIRSTARAIFKFQPSSLIFPDDPSPHPQPMLIALRKIFGAAMPSVFMHVYGSFVHGADAWVASEKALLGVPVKLICASERHRRLVASLVQGGDRQTAVCPFPVQARTFKFDLELREEQRRALKLSPESRMILYAGRLTYQKNVLRLISESVELMKNTSLDMHLYLAGHIDLYGEPYNFEPKHGLFYQDLLSLLSSLPQAYRDRIHFLENLEAMELCAYYNATDLFVSLSTFHDDDYGMAPIEALATGCPAVLTKWGGLASFTHPRAPNRFVDVGIDGEGLFISSAQIQEQLDQSLRTPLTSVERRHRASNYAEGFSIPAIAERLRAVSDVGVFRGFTPEMHQLSVWSQDVRRSRRPMFTDMTRDSFYRRLYGCYFDERRAERAPSSLEHP